MYDKIHYKLKKKKKEICVLNKNHVQVFVAPCTVAHEAAFSLEFFWQEY